MTATVFPFPLARRRDMIARQSRYAAELNPDSAERFIRQQLKIQGDNMRRRGVPQNLIAHELTCMEAAIRRELQDSVSTSGPRGARMKSTSGKTSYLRLDCAIDHLHHRDAWMVKMHTPSGMEWFILPRGGRVKTADAKKILARPEICAQEDCLLPGLSQTWRMVR